MPVPRIRFGNNDKAAHAVLHYLDNLRPSLQRFALRPYNRFLPDFTEWWLIPQSDWPAYRYSKLFFHRFQQSATKSKWFYTGFYVEKGLGKQLTGMADVNIRHIMQDDWYWYDFVRHTKGGEMDSAVREVLLRSQQPVVVSIDAYEFNCVPEPDTDRQLPHDWIVFTVHSEKIDFQITRPSSETLIELNGCANLRELGQCLEGLKDLDYFWLNLLIGIRLQYGAETSGTWGAAEIWHNALEPWNPWIR